MSKPSIQPLIDGYKRFKQKYYEESNSFEKLVRYGQKPITMVISCCDSRVDPAILTDCNPGELFVVRNVANLVPPYDSCPTHHSTSAALEYAICVLNVKNVIVLGHSHCGGIETLMQSDDKNDHSDFLGSWIQIAKKARQAVIDENPELSFTEKVHECGKKSLVISLMNLKTFPWIEERIKNNELSIHAWYFHLESGNIQSYQDTDNEFVSLI